MIHKEKFCTFCETSYVECGYCGNNCCNAGTGKLPDGSQCGCKEAYRLQEIMWQEELNS